MLRDFLEEKGIASFFCDQEIRSREQAAAPATQILVHASDLALARSFLAEREQAKAAFRTTGGDWSTDDRRVVLCRYRDMPQALVERGVLLVRELYAAEAERVLNSRQTGILPGE